VLERITDQPHHPLRLLIRIAMSITVRAPHLSHGRMRQQVTALGLVAPPLMHAAFEHRPFGVVHHAPQPQQEAIIIIELVASFVNRSNLLKLWGKTETCEVRASGAYEPNNAAITRIPAPYAATESHHFSDCTALV